MTNSPPFCAVFMKSGNLNFMEPSGPLQACKETALPLPFTNKCFCILSVSLFHKFGFFVDCLRICAFAGILLKQPSIQNSEVCHPRCACKLYGEVNSIKKHNYKIWLNDGVY